MEVSFKGLITEFGAGMNELWSVENGHTNLPKKSNIQSCENMSVATPSMLTMPQEEHFGLQEACLMAWGDKHEIPLVYGVSWMVRQGRKGGWSSRLHIAQGECLGHLISMGCNIQENVVQILGTCMGLSWGYNSSQKISAKGVQEWGFYKTQQVTYQLEIYHVRFVQSGINSVHLRTHTAY